MVAKSALVIKPLRVSAGEYSAVAIQLAWFDTEKKGKSTRTRVPLHTTVWVVALGQQPNNKQNGLNGVKVPRSLPLALWPCDC